MFARSEGLRLTTRVFAGLLIGSFLMFAAPVAVATEPLETILGPISPPKAVIIGDSIARGAGGGEGFRATDSFTFHMFAEGLFVTTMAHHLGMAVNLPRYNEALEEQNAFDPWKFAMVLLGTNDFSVGAPILEIVDRYAEFLDTAIRSPWYQHPTAPQVIFCVTPLARGDEKNKNEAGYTLLELRAAIRDLCQVRSLPVIEGPDLLPADERLRRGGASAYSSDGLHLNAIGHRLVGQNLLERVLTYFASNATHPPMESLRRDFEENAERDAEKTCKIPGERPRSRGGELNFGGLGGSR